MVSPNKYDNLANLVRESLCNVLRIYKEDSRFAQWAERWIEGEDRTHDSAFQVGKAVEVFGDEGYAAEYAAAAAAYLARYKDGEDYCAEAVVQYAKAANRVVEGIENFS